MAYRVTSTYMFPFKEDLFRFDFEVDSEDEHLCSRIGERAVNGIMTPPRESKESTI